MGEGSRHYEARGLQERWYWEHLIMGRIQACIRAISASGLPARAKSTHDVSNEAGHVHAAILDHCMRQKSKGCFIDCSRNSISEGFIRTRPARAAQGGRRWG